MDRIQTCIWDHLCGMSGEEVAKALTDYHGNQLLDKGFYQHMVDEGYMDDELRLLDDYAYDEEDE